MQDFGTASERHQWIAPEPKLSVGRQCELLGVSRSGFYYEPVPESEENLAVMRRMDELFMNWPSYGSRRLTVLLQREGVVINRKRVVRLMEEMGLEAVYPKRSLSQPGVGHRIYPYLLEGLAITGPDQVLCSDITHRVVKAETVPALAGGESVLKDPVQVFRCDANAFVRHGDFDHLGSVRTAPNGQPFDLLWAILNSMAGVADEIHQNLEHFVFVHHYRRRRFIFANDLNRVRR